MSSESSLGARLRQARERAGLSQQDAAEAIGVAREIVSYWENERRTPGPGYLDRLAATYDTSIDYLYGRERTPSEADEHAALYRSLTVEASHARNAVRRWLTFLNDWADLLERCGARLSGRARPPKELMQTGQSTTDSRRAPAIAQQVRGYYRLGLDAIPDLFAFLDEQGTLVYRASLGPLTDPGGVSGIFYNHARLGYCICINSDTTRGRQLFTLAHEFSHALFHYHETGLVSRASSADRKERFADAFAGHFLVPGAALHDLVRQVSGDRVRDPFAVIRLQRYFRVSYATMLYRLLSEDLLTQVQYEEYQGYSPSHLAAQLGLDTHEYRHQTGTDDVTLSIYPTSVLERVRTLVQTRELDAATAGAVLQVPQEAILSELLAVPKEADPDERREFAELPPPPRPRKRRVRT